MATPQARNRSSKQLFFSPAFQHYFPVGEFGAYDAFLNVEGERVKSERRTRVVTFQRRPQGPQDAAQRAFVLKIYHYPFLPSIRTGFQRSKAEREYLGLNYLKQQGLAAAEPVAFGSARTWLGLVQSCFVITDFVEETINLSQWRAESAALPDSHRTQDALILQQIGSLFRRLHQKRFFLFASKPKNILIRRAATSSPELFLIDVPYSRTVRWGPIARWARARDLGTLLGNFYPSLTRSETAAFYKGYLPDPLGGSESLVQTQVDRVIRATQHRTPLRAFFNPLRQALKSKA